MAAAAAASPITVLLFAGPRELLGGAPSVAVSLAPPPAIPSAAGAAGAAAPAESPPTVAALRAALAAAHPELAALLPSCRFAVACELVAPGDEAARIVGAREEVALLAPVSGG